MLEGHRSRDRAGVATAGLTGTTSDSGPGAPEAVGSSGRFGHRPGLDALRGILVAVILWYHLAPHQVPLGVASIDVFLVLSGFLICTLLLTEIDDAGRSTGVDLRGFWMRRARRLIPGLYVMLGVVVVASALGVYESTEVARTARGSVFYAGNIVQFGGDYFSAFGQRNPLEHLWTLAVEEQGYLALAIGTALLALACRTTRSARLVLAVAAVLAMALTTLRSRGLVSGGADSNRIYMGFDTRAVALCVGVLLAVLLWRRWSSESGPMRAARAAGLALVAVLVVAAVVGSSIASDRFASGGWLVSSLLCALLVVLAVRTTKPGAFTRLAPLRWAGTRSYGIYLWHLPLVVLIAEAGGWLRSGVAVLATIAAAELSFRFVESPFRGNRVSGRSFVMLVIGASVVLVAMTYLSASDEPVPEEVASGSTFRGDDPPPESATQAGGDPAPAPDAATTARERAQSGGPDGEPTTSISRTPQRVLVWGGSFATIAGAALADTAADLTVVAHPQCVNPGDCRTVRPGAEAQGFDLVVLAIGGPEAFHSPPSNPYDVSAPERGAARLWAELSVAFGDVPVGLLTPPDERESLGEVLHLRHHAGNDPANFVFGADPTQWPGELAERLEAQTQGAAKTKVMLVGDSVAWSLATRFAPDGAVVWDRSQHGCNTAAGRQVSHNSGVDNKGPVCDWREDWTADVAEWDPDVVVLHTGTWESYDRQVDGRRIEAGSPEWSALQRQQFEEAYGVLSAGGAVVVSVIQAPASETAPGKPFETRPEESPRRMAAVLEAARAAGRLRGDVVVLDAAEAVCTPDCGSPELRPDGVHYSREGAGLIAEWLYPQLAELYPGG